MAATLSYLASYKNVGLLFEKVAAAKIPDAFSQPYLYQTLGLKSKGDRGLIPLLRALGFIDAAGKPSPTYAALKNPSRAGVVIAEAVRRAYAPLFEANENAHKMSSEELRGLIAQVTGSDSDMTTKIAGTFNALVRIADFEATPPEAEESEQPETEEQASSEQAKGIKAQTLRPEFHYNIQVHLPSNATEETYLSIFNALRKAFQ